MSDDLGAIKEKAHRQGYEQGKAAGDTFGAAIREHVERLEAERDALLKAQSYTYIGKDGKSVLARDLEDERDAAISNAEQWRTMWEKEHDHNAALQAKLAKAVEALDEIAGKKTYADDPWGVARATLAELKGEKT